MRSIVNEIAKHQAAALVVALLVVLATKPGAGSY